MTQHYKTSVVTAFSQPPPSGHHRPTPNWQSYLLSMRLPAILLCALAFAFFLGRPLSCQVVTGALTGTVTDSTGAVIPNAKMTATQLSTMVSQETRPGRFRTAHGFSTEAIHSPFYRPNGYRRELIWAK